MKEIGENALNTGTHRNEFSNGLTIEFKGSEQPDEIDPKAFGSIADTIADDKGELHVTIPPEIYFPGDHENYSAVLIPALFTAGLETGEIDNLLIRGAVYEHKVSKGINLAAGFAALIILAAAGAYLILKTTS